MRFIKFSMAFLALFFCFHNLALSKEWKLNNGWTLIEESMPIEVYLAQVCASWSATVFAPGEESSCSVFGNLYIVDLMGRRIFYETGASGTREQFDLRAEILSNALLSGGYERLEELRNDMERRATKAQAAVAAEKSRKDYLAAYANATTLSLLNDFESRYRGNDPDSLIEKLAPRRNELQYKQYRDDFSNAKTSGELSRFISAYERDDRDRLIPEAKKRYSAALVSEEKIRETASSQEKARQDELANALSRMTKENKRNNSHSGTFTIDTSVYFAHKQGLGKARLFLSHQPFDWGKLDPIEFKKAMQNVCEDSTTSKCDDVGNKSTDWRKGQLVELNNIGGGYVYFAAWKEIVVNGKPLIAFCNPGYGGYGINCSRERKDSFVSTESLPKAPPPAKW